MMKNSILKLIIIAVHVGLFPRICKNEEFCFRYCDFLPTGLEPDKRHGESTSTASQPSRKINKVPILLQNLGYVIYDFIMIEDKKCFMQVI